ncbi:hypothetical protein [uncultured Sphingomonas sp.]|uniref:hypothetical protein n=1 Tax=uncultured Sphingomonas sp. TaxID=158754 RepID=UPI0025D7FDED|nr:hypothetical protein [uncultured Sphingomonas sp.]
MAARKPRKLPVKPTPTDADPQSWLYLNPSGPSPAGTVFAVLRRAYAGRVNSALEFGYRKAHLGPVVAGTDLSAWSPNVERIEVLLPAGADDSLADPATLLGQMDAHAVEREKALLTYLTLPLGDVERVHIGWERARAFLRDRFARDRQLASVLILHAPGTINAAFPLHAHALIVPRRLTGLGIRQGLYDEDMIHDRGQAIVEAMWADHLASSR